MEDYMILDNILVKKHAEVRVHVNLPGLWSGINNLTVAERAEHYETDAYDWEDVRLQLFIHYNWAYDFMRPRIDDIVKAYLAIYGLDEREEDIDEATTKVRVRRMSVQKQKMKSPATAAAP